MHQLKDQSNVTSHVLIFPLPIQGPVNAMLKLAELLLLSTQHELHITFLTTQVVHHNLLISANAREHFERDPRFSFQTFSDTLPEDHPRGGEKFMEMLEAVMLASQPILKEMVLLCNNNNININNALKIKANNNKISPVTCIITDALYNFAMDVGNEAGIPVFYFETMSPSCLWVYLCLPELFQAGEVPLTENKNLDTLVNVPGMEDFIRVRDLPDFCRARDAIDHNMMQRAIQQAKQFQRAQGIILNTFEEFDALWLSKMRIHCPSPIYTIGPLHLNLKEKLLQKSIYSNHSNSLLLEDKSCIAWLNKQPKKSVIYCSFGSQVSITKEQLIEFWHGLVDSGILFLWVKRQGSIIGMDDDFEMMQKHKFINEDLIEGIKKRGFIISWAPQVDVLNHPAIGGFLTHSGWNSTMESVGAGVPMICWPRYVDQLVISRLVTQVWKIGVDIKDTCDREIVAKMVKDVMIFRRDEFLKNVNEFAKLSIKSVHEGGSSFGSIQNLIKDIREFTMLRKYSKL